MNLVSQNLQQIREEIGQVCADVGRDSSDVTLVAVSKTKPIELMIQAFEAGQIVFGENYVQELEGKQEALELLDSDIAREFDFHLIGPLQSNKADKVVGTVSLIQTVDRLKIADVLSKCAEKKGIVQDVLLQVNISGEESKSGVLLSDLPKLLERCLEHSGINVLGLMCIGSALDGAARSVVEREFEQMRELREHLSSLFSIKLPHLSMGMSDDFGVAIRYGATIVRVGSRIFGERQ